MSDDRFFEIRKDCLNAAADQKEVYDALVDQRIAVTGGTGFLGTWIAETVAALNDEYRLGINLDLYARNVAEWKKNYPHLSGRSDFRVISQDVRSPFEFDLATSYVIHAAGIPNNRLHASDPLRVYQTTVFGTNNTLESASKLLGLKRLVNVSSCLVNGTPQRPGAITESDYFPIPSGQLHTVYQEAKRTAESLCAVFRSQFRMPVSTVRPFTFVGPYQGLDRPWAINNFMRDAINGGDIRIHGDGTARRSYLYGSDAAWWTLTALVNGADGHIYNIGSPNPIAHLDLVKMIVDKISPKPKFALNTLPSKQMQQDDLYPDIIDTQRFLGVKLSCPLEQAIDKTYRWYLAASR